MKSGKKRKWLLAQFLTVGLLLVSAVLFLNVRKERLVQEFGRFVEFSLGRALEAEVKIGKISGNVLGFIHLEDIEVTRPWMPVERSHLFRAKEIQVRYRFLDFLSKKFDSKVEIKILKPEIWWAPRLGLKKPSFPMMGWMRQWAMSQRNHWVLRVEDLTFTFGYEERKIKGIDLFFENNVFTIEAPVSHWAFGDSDISTVITLVGNFNAGLDNTVDAIRGRIHTEGTVINWKPLPQEFSFDFIFTENYLRFSSSQLLGGAEFEGIFDFTKDYTMDFNLKAQDYLLANLAPLIGVDSSLSPQGKIDVELRLYGSPWEPRLECRARIWRGWLTKKDFKVMDVNVSGVYPTLQLEDSRIHLEDGSVMRFADKSLEARDLFREETYERLIEEASQDTVVWGDWEFSRPQAKGKEETEFRLERALGERASVHFRKFNVQEPEIPELSDTARDMEVGFEYRLRAKDSLKLEFREDEEFVGVERRLRF